MVALRFTSCLLAFILLPLTLSSLQIHALPSKELDHTQAKELWHGGSSDLVDEALHQQAASMAEIGNQRIGGRKMMHKESQASGAVRDVPDEEVSKTTGEDLNASKNNPDAISPQPSRMQVSGRMLKVKSMNGPTSGHRVPRDSSPILGGESPLGSQSHVSRNSHGKSDSEEGDDNEIQNLMTEDYMGYRKPDHGKPPINNRVPLEDEEHQFP